MHWFDKYILYKMIMIHISITHTHLLK